MPNPVEATPNVPFSPPPKSSNLIVKLAVLVAIVMIVGGTLLFLKQFNLFPFTKISSPLATPAPTMIPNVFFQTSNDPSGRGIYYQLPKSKQLYYSGFGYYLYSPGAKFTDDATGEIKIVDEKVLDNPLTRYIVAAFDKWEDIPNSSDKYLVFGSQVSYLTKDQKTHEIKKVRVLMDKKDPKRSITALAVEDLSTIIPKVINSTDRATLYNLGSITDFSKQDLDKLIKNGDVLGISVFLDVANLKDFSDEDGIQLVSDIVLRRFNPEAELLQELGKDIIK